MGNHLLAWFMGRALEYPGVACKSIAQIDFDQITCNTQKEENLAREYVLLAQRQLLD